MCKIRLIAKQIIFFIFLTSIHVSECLTVKVINLTNEKITVDIHSTQVYPGWQAGRPVKRKCEFIGKHIDPHLTQDFDYKEVSPICAAPCTKSVTITSPIKLSSQSTLSSCSNVIVIIRKDKSNKWKIEYYDWSADILKMLEERTKMPAKVRDVYDQFGDSPIQTISVFRKPIQSGVKELMSIITKNELKSLNYDQLYHTGFIIKCNDQLIRLERNQTVSSDVKVIKPGDKQEFETRDIDVSKRTIPYNEFINKAMENDSSFWKYHPVNNNCQLFVLQCLEKNNIEVSEDLRKFIYQDAEQVLASSPILKSVAIASTSLANRIGKIVEGISGVTIQNGTPYTIRVQTRYARRAFLKACLPDDFLLESGKEKTVSRRTCSLEEIKVAASLKGAASIKDVPHENLQQSADIFAERSFVGKGKPGADFLIRSVAGNKFIIENISLTAAELQELALEARENPVLNLNLKKAPKEVEAAVPVK